MSLQSIMCISQFKYSSRYCYNAIILITLSIFMLLMVNYQSISATSDSSKAQSNDKTSDKISNTKTSDSSKAQSNDKTSDKISNTKTSLHDPTFSLPFTSHYADTLDKSIDKSINNPTDIPFP